MWRDEIYSLINCTRLKCGEMDRACTRMGEKRNAYTILVGEPEGKRPLGKPRRSWMGNVKIDLRGKEWDSMEWAQGQNEQL
jgi:hypothetical protein